MSGQGIVVIGAGQASIALISRLRGEGFDGPLTLIGAERHLPYQRPPLSKAYLKGAQELGQLMLRPERFYEDLGVTVRTGTRAEAIDPARRTVRLTDGDLLGFDQLALVTGAAARSWPRERGGDLDGVHTVRGIDDVDALRRDLDRARNVLVIGGGYIGLEIASTVRAEGRSVTIVEASSRILSRVAGEETSEVFRQLHRDNGVRLLERASLRSLLGGRRVEAAELADGQRIDCDVVVVGIGAVPETSLAAAAGLATDQGIATDAFGRTSCETVWAAGDCAAALIGSRRMRLESVGNAIDQGENVALNMLGRGVPYRPRPWFWTEQFSMRMQIAGLSAGHDKVVSRPRNPRGGRSFWYFRGPSLIAVDAVNEPQAYLAGRRLLDAGKTVDPVLVADANADLKRLGLAD